MSPQPCLVQPVFSQPRKKYANHKLGIANRMDNGLWIIQNRFALKDVGDQSKLCEIGNWGNSMPFEYWIVRCFERIDITSERDSDVGAFKCVRNDNNVILKSGWVPFNAYNI